MENLKQANENNDCVVRAIQHGFGITYDEAHKFAEEKLKRKPKKGVLVANYLPLFKKGKFFGKKISMIGEKIDENSDRRALVNHYQDAFDANRTIRCRMTVGQFLKQYKHGTFLISVRKHMFCVIDGEVFGNSEDCVKVRRPIVNGFQIEKLRN